MNMLSKLQKLKQNDFIRNNAVFFSGSLAVAVVNYAYYPVVGRLLGTAEFGEVQALISISIQIGLLFAVMANVTVNVVGNSSTDIESSKIVIELERLTTLVAVTIVGVALIFIEPIKGYLKFDDTLPFILIGLTLILGASTSMRNAFIRGKQAFGTLSAIGFVSAILKLLAGFILVALGFGTSGAIGGLLVASVVAWLYTRYGARKLGIRIPKTNKLALLPDMKLIRPQLPFAVLVFVVTMTTTVLFSIDVILAKYYFSEEVAGQYAGIATIGRIIFFLTASVAIVLLTSIKLSETKQQNRKVLVRSIALTTILGGSALLAFALAPELFIKLLIGSKYLVLADLLPKLSLTLFLISILNLFFGYDIALRRWSIAIIAVAGAVITMVIMAYNHENPSAMVTSLLLGVCSILAIRALDSIRRNLPIRQ